MEYQGRDNRVFAKACPPLPPPSQPPSPGSGYRAPGYTEITLVSNQPYDPAMNGYYLQLFRSAVKDIRYDGYEQVRNIDGRFSVVCRAKVDCDTARRYVMSYKEGGYIRSGQVRCFDGRTLWI
ncbi:unnamed protein product [Nippostrongylus brasiliensis]|uniref:SPOR domain-containing protein n=1 Tax=Nippostrongylus brasiliensis TaxID=27835 RepID=A0A0N4XUC4_NIPBR|nr:unnamed protein product [Nippostrongylus brasiliensis]